MSSGRYRHAWWYRPDVGGLKGQRRKPSPKKPKATP